MPNFPEIMIVRYYEGGIMEVTYSDDGSEKNRNIISERLDKELENNKYLESFEIFFKGENVGSEEKR